MFFSKLIFNVFLSKYIACINLDLDQDKTWAKILDPDADPNSMYLDPHHCSEVSRAALNTHFIHCDNNSGITGLIRKRLYLSKIG